MQIRRGRGREQRTHRCSGGGPGGPNEKTRVRLTIIPSHLVILCIYLAVRRAFVEVNKANTTLEEKLKKTQEDVFDLEKQLEASKSKLASANEHIQTLKKKLDQKSLDINGLNASNRELVSGEWDI